MSRPEVLNAVNAVMVEELTRAFGRAKDDADVRAVTLTGAGRAFAAGADMRELVANHTPEFITELIAGKYKPLLMAIATCPKTVIAAIRGPAAGMVRTIWNCARLTRLRRSPHSSTSLRMLITRLTLNSIEAGRSAKQQAVE